MRLGRTRTKNSRATLSSETYLQAAIEHAGAVLHAPEPNTVNAAVLGLDTRAIVEDLQEQRVPVTPVAQLNILRRTMP